MKTKDEIVDELLKGPEFLLATGINGRGRILLLDAITTATELVTKENEGLKEKLEAVEKALDYSSLDSDFKSAAEKANALTKYSEDTAAENADLLTKLCQANEAKEGAEKEIDNAHDYLDMRAAEPAQAQGNLCKRLVNALVKADAAANELDTVEGELTQLRADKEKADETISIRNEVIRLLKLDKEKAECQAAEMLRWIESPTFGELGAMITERKNERDDIFNKAYRKSFVPSSELKEARGLLEECKLNLLESPDTHYEVSLSEQIQSFLDKTK